MALRNFGFCAFAAIAGAVGWSAPAHAETLEPGDPADLFKIETAVADLVDPTSFGWLPDGRMIISELTGEVYVVQPDGNRELLGAFDAGKTVGGLFNFVIPPNFEKNRELIFMVSVANTVGDDPDFERHRVVAVPLGADLHMDMKNAKTLIGDLKAPGRHDGGAMAFGPDGKLYIGNGDTGCMSSLPPEPVYTPTNFYATCLTNANGKILRINIDGSIPDDNPLVGKMVTACGNACKVDPSTLPLAPAREEIWAWGFRNPWRMWIDPQTGNLWVGDVGEKTYEEISVILPSGVGRHYGWPWREAAHGHPATTCRSITPGGNCIDPDYYCKHGDDEDGIDGECRSVTGGVIVDSCEFPEKYRGRYFFADNGNGWIATLQPTPNRNGIVEGSREMFAATDGAPVNIAVGPDHMLYYASVVAMPGEIRRIVPKHPEPCATPVDGGQPDGSTKTDGGSGGSNGGGSGGASGGETSETGGATGRPPDAGRPPPPDAGKPPPPDAGASKIAAKAGGGMDCSCHVEGRASGKAPALLAMAALAVLRRRRNRRVAS